MVLNECTCLNKFVANAVDLFNKCVRFVSLVIKGLNNIPFFAIQFKLKFDPLQSFSVFKSSLHEIKMYSSRLTFYLILQFVVFFGFTFLFSIKF